MKPIASSKNNEETHLLDIHCMHHVYSCFKQRPVFHFPGHLKPKTTHQTQSAPPAMRSGFSLSDLPSCRPEFSRVGLCCRARWSSQAMRAKVWNFGAWSKSHRSSWFPGVGHVCPHPSHRGHEVIQRAHAVTLQPIPISSHLHSARKRRRSMSRGFWQTISGMPSPWLTMAEGSIMY